MLADLSNEVYFKKVFTDVDVFKAFTKDILNIDLDISKVETEKVLPEASNIQFKMDLFAEDKTNRTVVEIQKIDYAYNHARFLHYFMSNLVDLQRNSRDYEFAKSVYLIVIITGNSVLKDKYNQKIRRDILINDQNPVDRNSKPYEFYSHKMMILNPNYLSKHTPKLIHKWLHFISESIANRENPSIDLKHRGIARAAQLADVDMITGEERFKAKESELKRQKIEIDKKESFEKGIEKGKTESVLGFYKENISPPIIAKALNISEKRVQEIIKSRHKG